MKNLLTVCVGNICRSPMAEALLAQALPQARVHSAGIGALVGHAADDHAIALMKARGLDISAHRAQQLDTRLCQQHDLLLVMERQHKTFIEQQFPFARGKVFCLGQFENIDIPDPYQQDRAAFEYALQLIDQGVATWSQKIARL
ncbi:MAG: low molecular weight protein-tyrosine-phosphatase [Comamonas sp.]